MTKISLDTEANERRCVNGIIPEYLEYAEGQESPSDFHLWCILGAIGCSLGRTVWLDRFFHKIYPNLYIILIGESALVHKNTALNMAIHPLREAYPDLFVVTQKISPQKLSSMLADIYEKRKVSELLIHANELSVLLGQSKLDDTLLKVLTDYWDCPVYSEYSTVARGVEVAKDVCINLMGGTTPSWLKNSLPLESLEGGFLSRLILVSRPASGIKQPHPEDLASASKFRKLENVTHDLCYINTNIAGPYEWDPEAKRLFSNWYINHNAPEKAVSFMRGYYGRKGDMIVKLAMINAASKGDEKIITKEDIFFGISILNENEVFIEDVIKGLGTTEDGKKYQTILDRIKSNQVDVPRGTGWKTVTGMEHSKLMRAVGHQFNGRDLSEVISSLISADEIVVEYIGKKKVYVSMEHKALPEERSVEQQKLKEGGNNE